MSSTVSDLGVGREDPPGARRRRSRRPLAVVAVLLVTVAALVGVALFGLQASLDRNIERFGDPFAAIPERSRPEPAQPAPDAPAVGDVQTILLVGSDSRISAGDPTQWQAGAQRTDAIMLARVPADRTGAYVVSIPRDSWVEVPGHGMNKVNAAFSFGGPALMVQTVEQLTGVRVDHVAVVDFTGFRAMTDALGGVDITVAADTADGRSRFTAGTHRMDGETALDYVRQRKGLPGGDLDRVKRQQNWIRAVMSEALSRGIVQDPLELNAFLRAVTSSLAVDDGWTTGAMRDLAFDLRGVRSKDVEFMTAPVAGLGRSEDGQSIVRLDADAGEALWQAFRQDDLAAWVAEHPDAVLGRTVR